MTKLIIKIFEFMEKHFLKIIISIFTITIVILTILFFTGNLSAHAQSPSKEYASYEIDNSTQMTNNVDWIRNNLEINLILDSYYDDIFTIDYFEVNFTLVTFESTLHKYYPDKQYLIDNGITNSVFDAGYPNNRQPNWFITPTEKEHYYSISENTKFFIPIMLDYIYMSEFDDIYDINGYKVYPYYVQVQENIEDRDIFSVPNLNGFSTGDINLLNEAYHHLVNKIEIRTKTVTLRFKKVDFKRNIVPLMTDEDILNIFNNKTIAEVSNYYNIKENYKSIYFNFLNFNLDIKNKWNSGVFIDDPIYLEDFEYLFPFRGVYHERFFEPNDLDFNAILGAVPVYTPNVLQMQSGDYFELINNDFYFAIEYKFKYKLENYDFYIYNFQMTNTISHSISINYKEEYLLMDSFIGLYEFNDKQRILQPIYPQSWQDAQFFNVWYYNTFENAILISKIGLYNQKSVNDYSSIKITNPFKNTDLTTILFSFDMVHFWEVFKNGLFQPQSISNLPRTRYEFKFYEFWRFRAMFENLGYSFFEFLKDNDTLSPIINIPSMVFSNFQFIFNEGILGAFDANDETDFVAVFLIGLVVIGIFMKLIF